MQVRHVRRALILGAAALALNQSSGEMAFGLFSTRIYDSAGTHFVVPIGLS